MSQKMKCHSKWNVTQNGTLLKTEVSLKIKSHLEWNVAQNGMSLKMKCH